MGKKTIKAMVADVYRCGSDCSNGGVTSRFDKIYYEHPEGFLELDAEDLPENFMVLKEEPSLGAVVKRFYPYRDADGRRWMMWGGTFAYSSDSRFPGNPGAEPVKIFDRHEG